MDGRYGHNQDFLTVDMGVVNQDILNKGVTSGAAAAV